MGAMQGYAHAITVNYSRGESVWFRAFFGRLWGEIFRLIDDREPEELAVSAGRGVVDTL